MWKTKIDELCSTSFNGCDHYFKAYKSVKIKNNIEVLVFLSKVDWVLGSPN